MLIDDDVPMLNYLKLLIDWKALNLNIVCSTYSSMQALKFFKEHQPDLVITDIGLPQMDGLEIAEAMKKIKPDVRIIFLTCHEDFYYAKKAIQLNVDEYLIKDELNGTKLKQSLTASMKQIKEQRQQLNSIHLTSTVHRNKDLLKQSLYEDINSNTREEELILHARSLDIHWNFQSFMIGIASFNYADFQMSYQFKDLSTVQYGCYNIAEEYAKKYKGLTIFMDKNHHLVILYNFKKSLEYNHIAMFHKYMKEVQKLIFDYLKIHLYFYYEETDVPLTQIKTCCKRIHKWKDNYFYKTDQTIHAYRENKETNWHAAGKSFIRPLGEHLHGAIKERQINKVHQTMHEIEKVARANHIHPSHMKEFYCYWLHKMDITTSINTVDEAFNYFIRNSSKINEMYALVHHKLEHFLQTNAEDVQSTQNKKPKLQEIENYILKNLSKNITSVNVANALFLNPSYFSRYFKTLTGENFTDYVNRLKMNIAGQLLSEHQETVEIVAMQLGYSDRTYFSKVFKKYMNITPGEYKKLHK